jgi:hypothetical protein
VEDTYTLDQLLWFRKYSRAEILQDNNVAVMDNVMSSFKNLFDSKAKAEEVRARDYYSAQVSVLELLVAEHVGVVFSSFSQVLILVGGHARNR